MIFFVVGVCVILVGSVLAAMAARLSRLAAGMAVLSVIAGCALAAVPVAQVLTGATLGEISWPWQIPGGSFHIAIDSLSAWFLLPILILSPLAAIYGAAYLAPRSDAKKKQPQEQSRVVGTVTHGRDAHATHYAWTWFNLLVASMMLVVVARNAMLFLLAWEVMSLTSFLLVVFDDRDPQARRAGWTYLIATHLGTAFLLVMFLILGQGSLEFDAFSAGGFASVAFLLAVVGFGTKGGFMPLHVWLPEAHPAAPSHVSALMSGAMIKVGLYGLLRTLSFLGPLQEWWGWTLLGVGGVSAILGVLMALSQTDLKRVLAYSSVENMGIINIGIGLGLIGLSRACLPLAVLGLAGAMLHVLNHAVFKGLLFLGAGSVLHASGTKNMDRLGGLSRSMPWTTVTFAIGSAAIAGLPPFNGFIGEFLIYFGSFSAVGSGTAGATIAGVIVVAALALIGGLAAACFARATGIVFLGAPRSEEAQHAHEAPLAMRTPQAVLATICLVLGLAAPVIIAPAAQVAASILRIPPRETAGMVQSAMHPLWSIVMAAGILGVLACSIALVRRWLLKGRTVGSAGTWDCGYIAPTPRMQYTASSFAQPLVSLFGLFIGARRRIEPPRGLLPTHAAATTHAPDMFLRRVFAPAFEGLAWAMSKMRWLQHGRLQLYVLYIVLALLALLVWKLG